MRSFRTTPAYPLYPTSIHPALNSFADECAGTLARLAAYVGVLTLLAMAGLRLWDELPVAATAEPAAKAGWSQALRSHPAFAVSQTDLLEKTETYEIFRHPEGGRKDILHWMAPATTQSEKPVAELEIYRPGGEFSRSEAGGVEIAARMDAQGNSQVNSQVNSQGNPQGSPQGSPGLEAAGVIDSKFGPVALLRLAGNADGAKSCLGFIKRIADPNLQLSGWSCQGDGLPARRAAIGCMLNRLTLLTAGNEPKLAELFARAELKRGNCAAAAAPATSPDWVMGTENPRLRGLL